MEDKINRAKYKRVEFQLTTTVINLESLKFQLVYQGSIGLSYQSLVKQIMNQMNAFVDCVTILIFIPTPSISPTDFLA